MHKIKLVILALCSTLLSSQTIAGDRFKVGMELDAIPYLLGGYYASALVAIDGLQLRFITTTLEMPDFYVQSGFDDNEIDVRAFILDYYFDHTLQGFWIGAGLENWQGTVTESSSNTEKEYDSNLFTIGGGYTYYLNQYFYINPWIGIHVPVSGDDNVTFTDSSFDIKTTTEASIKFGYKF